MGNGFLSGKVKLQEEFQSNDIRNVITRFNKENMEANQPVLHLIQTIAAQKECTMAQIALAWDLKGWDFVVPIPGMRKEERIRENLGAADVELTDAEYDALNEKLAKLIIHGNRDGKDIKKLGTVPDNVDR